MRGKKLSIRQKKQVAETQVRLAVRDKVLPEEVSQREVARLSHVPRSTVKDIMNQEEYNQFVHEVKRELAIKFTDLIRRQLDYAEDDLLNGRFADVSPAQKYTSIGITSDKLAQLIGYSDDPRIQFSQNNIDISAEISRILSKNEESETKSE